MGTQDTNTKQETSFGLETASVVEIHNMKFAQDLKRLELAPLFACTAIGMSMAGFYLLRLATKGPEVTWSRVKNPEPWKVIGPTHRVKFYSPHDYSQFTRPAPQEAYDAVNQA